MSETRDYVVDLRTDEPIAERTRDLRAWLLDTGWLTPGGVEDWLHPGAETFVHGPAFVARFPRTIVNAAIVPEDRAWVAGEGTAPPACFACGADPGPGGDWPEPFIGWLNGAEPEPELTCDACGRTAPAGEWNLRSSAARSSLALALSVYPDRAAAIDPAIAKFWGPDVAPVLRDDLRRSGLGRWAWIEYSG